MTTFFKSPVRVFLCLLFLLPLFSVAQLYPVPLAAKVAESQVIVEGRVGAQRSFWNPQRTMIFTENTIEVSRCFKGEWRTETIQVLTQGGSVGLESITADHLAQFEPNQKGLFFLKSNTAGIRSPYSGQVLFDVCAAEQGALIYSIGADKAVAPFAEYDGITSTLYAAVQSATGLQPLVVSNVVDVDAERAAILSKNKLLAPGTITSFSPATVRAGALTDVANNVLTINGAGFGAGVLSGGSVVFRDGNTSTAAPSFAVAASSSLVISWSDNQIQLRVPSRAATGTFAVVNAPGDTAFSATPLQVDFAVLTATFTDPTIGTKESRLVSRNFMGGYNVVYSTNTSGRGGNIVDSPVYAAMQRAFDTWRKTAGVNFVTTGTTQAQSLNASDGESVVMLDNDNTGVPVLASGVLAVCYSRNSICLGDPNFNAQKTEFDIVIRNQGVSAGSTVFENGPCAPPFVNPGAIDMETVLLHELGHALNLAHINDPRELPAAPFAFANYVNPAGLMHFAVSTWATRRSPERSALDGARYAIQPRNLPLGLCGISAGEMTPLNTEVPANDNCPASFPTTPTAPGTVLDVNLFYATANKAVDPVYTGITTTNGEGTGVTNNVYFAVRTSGSGSFTFSVSGYNTLPAQVAATCGNTQGVRLSIYDVNGCPAGQNFPPPIYSTLIQGDGIPPAATGLQANKTYLLYFDGHRNTKARFNLRLDGVSLPIVLSAFTGRVLPNGHHLLTAQIASASNVEDITVEHSTDAFQFTGIGLLGKPGNGFAGSLPFTWQRPATGMNYYRLRITDKDGTVRYSNIVTLQSAGIAAWSVLPNPFAQVLYVQAGAGNGTHVLRLTDAGGRLVFTRTLATASPGARQLLSLPSLPAGLYLAQVLGSNGETVFSGKLLRQ